LTSIERSYGCIERAIVITNGSCYLPVGSSGTMTSPVSKKQQEAATQKEIAKRRQLCDESESESSSGSEVPYNITISDESLVRTTRAKPKGQEASAATTSPLQSDEGSEEDESDGENPPTDNTGKGNDDVAQSGEGDTNVEESNDKDSGVEESNEQGEDSGITPEAKSKRWCLQGIARIINVNIVYEPGSGT
ncbi:hypothetical protein HAX54_021499, partial [Datura stramonium]|nr:hypothetical protein [Datura stramonium]